MQDDLTEKYIPLNNPHFNAVQEMQSIKRTLGASISSIRKNPFDILPNKALWQPIHRWG